MRIRRAIMMSVALAVFAFAGTASEVSAQTLTAKSGSMLGFDDATMAAFKARVQSNKDVADAWAGNKADADRLLEQPLDRITADPRKLGLPLDSLVLAWRMTGDRRYADRIHDILLRLCAQSSWVTDKGLLKRDPPWNSDLGMGFEGQMFGRAYSTIRPILTPAERRVLVDGYVKGVVRPVMGDWIDGGSRIHTLDTMGHNWWAHIVFGMGVGLVAILLDEPRAGDWLRQVDDAGRQWWTYAGSDIETKIATFDSDGGYNETVNYGNLGLNSYLEFRQAWLEGVVQPPEPAPLLHKTLDFFINNAYPSTVRNVSVDFGDGSLTASGASTLATAWAIGEHRPEYLWYINLFNRDDAGNDLHKVPHVLVKVPMPSEAGGQGRAPDLPMTAWYRGMGWATLRSSWQPDATMLAIRSGFTWNHNHADTGSFILYDQGQPLLIDSGNSSYAAPEYDAYYRQSVAHNVITFNGKAEPEEDTYLGSQIPGLIPLVMDGAGIRYVFADATGPTSANFSRNFRHVVWIDDVILIVDDVKAREPGQFEWLVHPAGEAKVADGALRVVNGDAGVDVRPLYPRPLPTAGLPTDYPEDMRLITHQGYEDHNPKTRTAYFGFAPADKTERAKFVTALVLKRAQTATKIERVEDTASLGVRITSGSKVTSVYFNLKADGSVRHRNAIAKLGDWETDAYMLAVTEDERRMGRVFVADGSYLRKDGQLMFDSLSKRFLIADLGAPETKLWAAGQAGGSFFLKLPGMTQDVQLNGKPVDLRRVGGRSEIVCCDTVFGQ